MHTAHTAHIAHTPHIARTTHTAQLITFIPFQSVERFGSGGFVDNFIIIIIIIIIIITYLLACLLTYLLQLGFHPVVVVLH